MCGIFLTTILYVIILIVQGNAQEEGCRFLRNPLNGHATLHGKPTQFLEINDKVPPLSVIKYVCDFPNAIVIGSETNLCEMRAFRNETPKCEVRCNPANITCLTFIASCQSDGNDISCTKPARPGTKAQIFCQPMYRYSHIQVTTCNQNGQWDPIPQPCEQICGEKSPESIPFRIDGQNEINSKMPWHVGVYMNKIGDSLEYICGGSIINPRVVISAMHCFWESSMHKAYPPCLFRIVTGKYYRQLNHKDDREARVYAVKQIHSHETYNDYEEYYSADIAIVSLKESIVYSVHVAPVCIRAHQAIGSREVEPNSTGLVTGWSVTNKNGGLSDKLNSVEVNVISRDMCQRNMPQAFHPFITDDKICGTQLNQTVMACSDGGAGLVIAEREKGVEKYYLRGITSTENKTKECDSNFAVTYLNIAYYSDWIMERGEWHRMPFKADVSTTTENTMCTLRVIPENALVYDLDLTKPFEIEDEIEDGQSILYTCKNMSYELIGYGLNICNSGVWYYPMPSCELMGEIATERNTVTDRSAVAEESQTLAPGTHQDLPKSCPNRQPPARGYARLITNNIMVFQCQSGYGLPQNQSYISNCIDGQWDSEVPNCIRACNALSGATFQSTSCISNGQPLDCNWPVPTGTVGETVCRNTFEGRNLRSHRCLANGHWHPEPAKCNPVCGRMPANSYIPWHVGLYKKNGTKMDWQCSGTLIHSRIILTSRFCLTAIENDLLKVVAGKLHRDYDVVESTTQIRNIERIEYDRRHDYAIVIVDADFEFETGLVAPVCLNARGRIPTENIFVPGWRANSDHLEKVYFNNDLDDRCGQRGEMCAIESEKRFESPSSCAQLQGGGLVSLKNGVYHLRGVATGLGLTASGCSERGSHLFLKTNVIKTAFRREIRKFKNDA